MFKKTILALSIAFIAVNALAQQGVTFKLQYQPNHQYIINSDMKVAMVMDLKGDTAEVAKATKGANFPMAIKMDINTGAHITTGVKQAGKTTFPMTLKYDKFEMHQNLNGADMPAMPNPLTDVTIAGWCSTDGKIYYDTISAAKNAQIGMLNTMMVKMVNELVGQLKFPDKPMQIGETFEQVVSPASPIPSVNLKYNVKTVYKLISVSNGIANFTTVQTAIFDMPGGQAGAVANMDMKGNGKGEGTLKFDIAQKFITSMDSNFNLDYNIKVDKVTMAATAGTKMGSQVTIIGN